MPSLRDHDIQALLDRAAITTVISDWAIARDTGQWARLRACYTADGTMHTTWFVGTADEFVERSMQIARRGGRASHFIGASSIQLGRGRATAETRMTLLLRAMLEGVEVDVTCYGRFFDFFLFEAGSWRIRRRVPVYEKDRVDPVDPSCSLVLDRAKLELHPEGYRHLAYVQASGGSTVTQGLPTPNSEALTRLYAEGASWLADATGPATPAERAMPG